MGPRHVQDVASVARADVDEHVAVARHARGQPVRVDLSQGLTPYTFHVLRLPFSLLSSNNERTGDGGARARGYLDLVRARQRQPPSRSSGVGLRGTQMPDRISRPGRVRGQPAMRRGWLWAERQQGGRARCCMRLFTMIDPSRTSASRRAQFTIDPSIPLYLIR